MRFVTLFPQGSNVHLIKDVGQIPFMLFMKYGVDATLVSNNVDIYGPYIKDVQGLKLNKTYFRKLNWWRLGSYIYLFMNARKIDWLNIYHAGIRSRRWIRMYKRINPGGKVYLKLDMNFQNCNKLDNNIKFQKEFIKCLDAADLVSVESSAILKRIQPHIKKKILLIPNGYALEVDQTADCIRENVFLTVGRLGTKPKATEVLLKAFAMYAKKNNWNLKLIGTIEESFKPYIENYGVSQEMGW